MISPLWLRSSRRVISLATLPVARRAPEIAGERLTQTALWMAAPAQFSWKQLLGCQSLVARLPWNTGFEPVYPP